jgi:hypothetical protein
VLLRIARLEPGRYHEWKRASTLACSLDEWPAKPSSITSFRPSPSAATPLPSLRARRHRRSRWPIFAFTMTDLAVHAGRSSRSR